MTVIARFPPNVDGTQRSRPAGWPRRRGAERTVAQRLRADEAGQGVQAPCRAGAARRVSR
ncbi:MAG: hypothetical protein HXY24_06340 [Rubrivivax sp.]|nr:hypothetical protein [Rubrivivax sp.]